MELWATFLLLNTDQGTWKLSIRIKAYNLKKTVNKTYYFKRIFLAILFLGARIVLRSKNCPYDSEGWLKSRLTDFLAYFLM